MMKIILISSILLVMFTSSTVTCTFICPTPENWNSRAKEICLKPRYYHCLSNYEGTNYTERCLKPIQLPKGTYPVYALQTSGNLVIDAMPCPTERFQNNTYMSNQPGVDKCPYQKSNCSEEGQMIIAIDSGSEDNLCECDTQQGYRYIEHVERYCKPGFQNCSCFKNITSFSKTYNETEIKHHDLFTWQIILIIAASILVLIFTDKETAYKCVRSFTVSNQ